MIKAINAGIGKTKPFVKKTAMAAMFATSVIPGNANAKNFQKSEPITSQTEVVSKSGAEAISNLAQVQNNVNSRTISSRHNPKLDRKYIAIHEDIEDVDPVAELKEWYSAYGTFETSFMMQMVINMSAVTGAYIEAMKSGSTDFKAKTVDLFEAYKMRSEEITDLVLNPIYELGESPVVATAERCNKYIDNALILSGLATAREENYGNACETFEGNLKGNDSVINQSDLIAYKTYLMGLYAIQEIATDLDLHEDDEFYGFITSFIKNADPTYNK